MIHIVISLNDTEIVPLLTISLFCEYVPFFHPLNKVFESFIKYCEEVLSKL